MPAPAPATPPSPGPPSCSASAAPQQILATVSTAVMASPALPTGAELVDRGIRVLGRQQTPERIYELRSGRAGLGGDHDDDGASNLEWARRAARGPVLGREEPLDALALAWKAALHGNRRTVLLAGEGGIGKTTVAAELALRLHADGALVLYGRWDQQALAPYQAVREALGTYAAACPTARLRADLEGWGDEITRLLPDVGARVGGVRAPLMGDPDGERMRLFEAIEAWLAGMARRRPVVLVLDDLHWADGSSRLLVEHLRHAPDDAPLDDGAHQPRSTRPSPASTCSASRARPVPPAPPVPPPTTRARSSSSGWPGSSGPPSPGWSSRPSAARSTTRTRTSSTG